LESLGKEKYQEVKKKKESKKNNKTMWYASDFIMKDQNLSSKPCTVVLKIIYITGIRKIIK